MTISPQKRQKQLAKKKAKRKWVNSKKPVDKMNPMLSSIRIADIPIYESRISRAINEFGIGTVILSRKIAPNYVSASFFLVDAYCLGVKNATFGNFSNEQYRQIIEEMSQRETFVNASPECVRKLVEEAINYAKDLGFRPDPDYHEAVKIFANIETAPCTQAFVFGREGKPCYIASPFEKSVDVKRIIEKLRRKCGPNGFKVFIPVDAKDIEKQGILSEANAPSDVIPAEAPSTEFSSVPPEPSTGSLS